MTAAGRKFGSDLLIVAFLLSSQSATASQFKHQQEHGKKRTLAHQHHSGDLEAQHGEGAFVKDLGEWVREFDFSREAENEGAEWEEDTLLNSVVPFSALRDPLDGKVRIFFDAEPWLHSTTEECHFAQTGHTPLKYYDENVVEDSHQELEVQGKLISLSDNTRAFDGYILICDDPGPQYTQVVFRSHVAAHHHLLLTVTIEEVERTEQHVLGMCSAPYFSKRVGFANWVHDSRRANITGFSIYYTDSDVHAFNELDGVRWTKKTWEPFVPVPLEGVQYFRYMPPLSRFYFSQSTILNECMYRNRHAMRYIVVADADEFIHVQQPGINLESTVESLLGDTFASVLLNALHYPRTCQADSTGGDDLQDPSPTMSLADTCHLFDPTYPRYDYPKSIINPRRGTQFMVHGLDRAEEGFRLRKVVTEDVMFFKHIRIGPHCSEEWRASMATDQEPQQIQEYMHSGPINKQWAEEP